VRLIRASATVDDVDTMLPDGLHRTEEGHRRTAELLAAEIKDWLKSS
jgi:lysophospholipase L1-like esterase